jgi:hypothetical protein
MVIVSYNSYDGITKGLIKTFKCYLFINKNYFNDLNKYDNYDNYTIGIIKKQNECYNNGNGCLSNIEYMIDNKRYNVNILTFDYKVGDNVMIYYNSESPMDIIVYDKTINKRLIIIIISIIILILLWISLFYCIPIIFQ